MHTFPQAPQSTAEVLRFTQAPLQLVSPVAQVAPHTPFEQTCPVVHTTPHAPQSLGSDVVSTHWPPHRCVPAGHTAPSVRMRPSPEASGTRASREGLLSALEPS